MTRARITAKGQITVPKSVRDQLGVRPGDSLEFDFVRDHFEIRPVPRRSIAELFGVFPTETPLSPAGERRRAWQARASRIEAVAGRAVTEIDENVRSRADG